MDTTCGDLLGKFGWMDIEPVLALLYPKAPKSMSEYAEAYAKLLAVAPTQTRMRITVRADVSSTPGAYYEVLGRNGALVKDVFQSEKAHKELGDKWEQEQEYDLSYTDWNEIKGMQIDPTSLRTFPEKELIARILVDITRRWHSDERAHQVLEELEAIKQGRREDLVSRQMIGRGDFLQVWCEKPNGEFHGRYAVYWDRGAMVAEGGIMIDDNKEGVWTYWERDGKVKKQIRFSCDKPIEEKFRGPWWEGAEDRQSTA